MERKWSELPDRAWISRFWAQYSALPEPFKKGFFSLAQYVAQENGGSETPLSSPFPGGNSPNYDSVR